jgi:capsular polysaccharide biosynthesis protein
MNNMQSNDYQEDEIDLIELWNTIMEKKVLVVIVTSIISIGAIAYSFLKAPTYEVKSNMKIGFIRSDMKIGFINKKPIIEIDTLIKELRIVFSVNNKIKTKENFISKVTNISKNRKMKNFIIITTEAISNDEALSKNKMVVKYIQDKYKNIINNYINDNNNRIRDTENNIATIEKLENKNIEKRLTQLKNKEIININKRIKFYNKSNIPSMKRKIKSYSSQIAKYKQLINKINKQTTSSSSFVDSSIAMAHYQDLILNSQNHIRDLELQIQKIENEIIPNLKLDIDRVNIHNDTFNKLTNNFQLELLLKKEKLIEKLIELKLSNSKDNVQNSKVIGKYIMHDYASGPNKKLIISVAFVTGLILSIFIVFFLKFIGKNDTKNIIS